jgi:hypothetical protein
MWLKVRWTVLFAAAALLTGSPAIADEDDNWHERHHRHKKKGKDKRKHKKDDPGYYIFYYVPRHTGATAVAPECPPPPLQDLSRRPDTAPMPQSEPRAYAKPPDAFPKESPQQRALSGERQREILQKELATEQDLLELARRELREQQGRIEREGGERSTLRPYIDNVELHERNVAALRRELSRLNR